MSTGKQVICKKYCILPTNLFSVKKNIIAKLITKLFHSGLKMLCGTTTIYCVVTSEVINHAILIASNVYGTNRSRRLLLFDSKIAYLPNPHLIFCHI